MLGQWAQTLSNDERFCLRVFNKEVLPPIVPPLLLPPFLYSPNCFCHNEKIIILKIVRRSMGHLINLY